MKNSGRSVFSEQVTYTHYTLYNPNFTVSLDLGMQLDPSKNSWYNIMVVMIIKISAIVLEYKL